MAPTDLYPGQLPPAAPAGRRHSILLVDDEEAVRVVTQRLLEKLGYRVTPADSAEGALEILRDGGASFDLVMTDVVMPGRSGIEMAREIRRTYGEQRVLFMSGYTARETGRPPDEPPQPFLSKPFSLQKLGDAVASAIREPPAEIDGRT